MRPICRALLPLTRRSLFRQVVLHSTSRLAQFNRLLHPNNKRQAQGLRKTVKNDRPLALNVRELRLPLLDYDPEDEEAAKDWPESKAVRRLLATALELERLTLEGSALVRRVLLGGKNAFRLPKLQTLRIINLDSSHVLLYDMTRMGRLRYLHGVVDLEIVVDQEWEDVTNQIAPPRRVAPVTNIKNLTLSAGVSLSTTSAANFISHFIRLTSLTLILDDLTELSLFLEAAPLTLSSLSVAFDPDIEWEDEEEGIVLDPVITRFTRLTSLVLGERTFSSNLFRVLSVSLPSLSSLFLNCGYHPDMAAAHLLDYLRARNGNGKGDQSTSSVPLQRLDFDAFYTWTGIMPSEHPERSDVAEGRFRIADFWELPTWTNRFTFEEAKEIERLAKELGVHLTGTLLEAIEAEALKVKEEKYLQDRADDVLLSLAELFSQC